MIKISEKQKKRYKRIENILFRKAILKIIVLAAIIFILGLIVSKLSGIAHGLLSYFIFVLVMLLNIYIILSIVYGVKRSLSRLFTAENIFKLVSSYIFVIIGILLLFSFTYGAVESLGLGYLTYGTCSDNFSTDMIQQDSQISKDYFYFAAITLFTVGYGDICPMGLDKIISMINSFIGNFFTVVIMVIVIYYYLKRKEEK